MIQINEYKCPILNKYYRVYNTSTSVIADVLLKFTDLDPNKPVGLICPMHEEAGSNCFIKIYDYNDKREEIINGYKEGNGKYNEVEARLKEQTKVKPTIDTKLIDEVERLKQQELKDLENGQNTLCILVGGFKPLK